ncbi:hypothetical protein BHE74_00027698 [Ensete ventricosum]|nr:hypothetical protein BHE74_00027698 [Ensete ventricosum]
MDIDGTVIWVVCVVGIVFGGVEVSGLGVEAAHLPEGRNPRIPFDLVPAAGEEQKETESRGRRAREEQTSGERDEVDAVWVWSKPKTTAATLTYYPSVYQSLDWKKLPGGGHTIKLIGRNLGSSIPRKSHS